MKKIFIPVFAALFVIMFSAFAAADANLGLTVTDLSATHNSLNSGSFNVNNTNTTTALTNLACTLTVVGFSPSPYSCSLLSSVAQGTSSTVGYSFTVPQFTRPASYTANLTVTGSAGSLSVGDSKLFHIVVQSTPALSVSWLTAPSNVYQEQLTNSSAVYNITNVGNVDLNVNSSADLSSLGMSNYNSATTLVLVGGSFTGTVNLNASDDTDVGSKTLTLNAFGMNAADHSLNTTASSSQSFSVLYPYCDNLTNITSSPVSISDIKNQNDVDGKDFHPLDSLSLSVKVKNNDNDNSHYAAVEMVVVQGNSEVSHTSAKSKSRIAKNDYATYNLNITLPADIEAGQAFLYVKVYNDDDSNNCQQRVLVLNIKKNSRDLEPTNLDYETQLSCGGTYTFSGTLVNVGDSDEDRVRVSLIPFSLSSKNTLYDETTNLYSGNDYSFSFDYTVPSNMTEGNNRITLKTEYDYDSDNEVYNQEDSFNYPVTIVNCKKDLVNVNTETSTAITSTESQVRFLVSNPSTYSQTYTTSATADWATISSVTPQTFTLAAGAQQYVTVKLTPNQDVQGLQTLNANVAYGSTTKAVSIPVTVQRSSTSMNVLDQVSYQFKYNTAWAVIDTVLVVAIVVLLVLIFVRKK